MGVPGRNQEFTVAVADRALWPLDGSDTVIAKYPIPDVSDEDLDEWCLVTGEDFARRNGTRLHHGVFIVTNSPDVVAARVPTAEHLGCEKCLGGRDRAITVLRADPEQLLLVGQLYWSPRP